MSDITVLIVDDEMSVLKAISSVLKHEKIDAVCASNSADAFACLDCQSFDLILLDIMMPGINGYQTCIEIRRSSNAPILFLSARTKDSDKTLGFSSGGDDYLAKPFSYNELISRAKALIRRYQVYRGKNDSGVAALYTEAGQNLPEEPLSFHHLKIDEAKEEVTSGGTPLVLTDTEYAMLLLLVKHRHQIFSAQHLYESVWNEPYYYGANNTVMVHIRNLRLKVEKDPKNPTLIKTVWGKGYRCD